MKSAVIAVLVSLMGNPLVLSAQEAPPKPFEITEKRNAAVGLALATGLVATNVTEKCTLPKDPTLVDPKKTLNNWNKRNGQYVRASLAYLSYASAVVGAQKGKEAGDAYYKNAQTEIQKHAALTLQDLFPTPKPNSKQCEKLLGRVARGEMDFKILDAQGKGDNFLGTLDEILTFHNEAMERNRKPPAPSSGMGRGS